MPSMKVYVNTKNFNRLIRLNRSQIGELLIKNAREVLEEPRTIITPAPFNLEESTNALPSVDIEFTLTIESQTAEVLAALLQTILATRSDLATGKIYGVWIKTKQVSFWIEGEKV